MSISWVENFVYDFYLLTDSKWHCKKFSYHSCYYGYLSNKTIDNIAKGKQNSSKKKGLTVKVPRMVIRIEYHSALVVALTAKENALKIRKILWHAAWSICQTVVREESRV